MKPALATITLFFFLFTFSTKPSSVRADSLEPVVDISGKKLKAGESYYVLSAFKGKGGGLSFNTFGNNTCPHVVVQERHDVHRGKPVKFLPLNSTNKVIYISSDLNIEFSHKITTCVESGVWKITKFISEALNVATNGVAGKSNVNWFRIEKAEFKGAYKIMYCPVPKFIVCDELRVFSYGHDGKRYVGDLANPGNKFQKLRVVFKKANVKNAIDEADAAAVMSI